MFIKHVYNLFKRNDPHRHCRYKVTDRKNHPELSEDQSMNSEKHNPYPTIKWKKYLEPLDSRHSNDDNQ